MHPVLFNLGNLTIYSYGVFMALAFITTVFLIEREASLRGMPPAKISNLCMITFIFSILGARIMYVVNNFSYYRKEPIEILMIHHGGLMYHGGFIAGFLSIWYYLRRTKLPFFSVMDTIAIYLPLGQAIGRIGCLLNGCCFGKESTLPWAIVLLDESTTRHPTQAYASLSGIAMFIILRLISQRYSLYRGTIFSLYLILYPISRIIIEEFRADLPEVWLGFSITQWISVGIFIAGILILICIRKSSTSRP